MVENKGSVAGAEVVDMATNTGIMDKLKDTVNPQAIAQKLKLSQAQLIDIGVFAGIGFLFGFFIKRYATYVIAFGLFVTGIILLSQFNMVSLQINWAQVYKFLRIDASVTGVGMNNVAAIAWEWARSNVLSASSFTIGLLVGLKVG